MEADGRRWKTMEASHLGAAAAVHHRPEVPTPQREGEVGRARVLGAEGGKAQRLCSTRVDT